MGKIIDAASQTARIEAKVSLDGKDQKMKKIFFRKRNAPVSRDRRDHNLGAALGPESRRESAAQNQFVGAWRFISRSAKTGRKIHKADSIGMFVFTRDGHGSIQAMERNPPPNRRQELTNTRSLDMKRRLAPTKSTRMLAPSLSTSRAHSCAA